MTFYQWLQSLSELSTKIDYKNLPYQVFVLVVMVVVVPILVTFIRRVKRHRGEQEWIEGAPRALGLKLFGLISSTVQETLKSDLGRFQSGNEGIVQSQVYRELCIDYAYMVFLALDGLFEDEKIETRVIDFVKNYIYPSVLCHLDLSLDDLQIEKLKLQERFNDYQKFGKVNFKEAVLPLARKMVEHFEDGVTADEGEVSAMITEICHVLNEVPILFYNFKYKRAVTT